MRREELYVARAPNAQSPAAADRVEATGDSLAAGRDQVIVLSEEVSQRHHDDRPVDRVWMYGENVVDREQTVTADLRHEEIDVDREPLSP